ncbi:hypothetical protein ACQEU5_10055 [Marinactinospora thermotolerans]|uniref:PQQ-like domain-containing protein n=1 Tax=Marinactinospora thermotolerans DSM 45154 TaxID=1122192 RepID=A0A1T4N5Z6_9ACTN|nr:hypothetical protein [Marinactinospora thermotolerans]SJZ74485.1 hypothetical protein SAMN02745673_01285 [Marinactinospora thermotolerans DSM 45154]
MRTWRRTPLAPVTGLVLLFTAVACTDEPPPEPAGSPSAVPTSYTGAAPPGLGPSPVRVLHGPGSDGPDILDDPMGVRFQGVGGSFLISSNSEEHHVLQDALDGTALWEGEQRVERFTTDREGDDVFEVSARRDGRTVTGVVDDSGARVWSGSDPRESYLNGWVVRRPEGWSSDDPHGRFSLLDLDGSTVWEFVFEPPADPEETPGSSTEEEPEEADAEDTGVPVAAHGNVVFLDDGTGQVQARDLDDGGALLWRASGTDPQIAGASAFPRPLPEFVGFYDLPLPEGDASAPGSASEAEATPTEGEEPPPRTTVLVRWGSDEDPSVLSLHDVHSGEIVWSLTEPGANPADGDFGPAFVPGTVHDTVTHTLLLPQGSGATPMIAVDLVSGRIRWTFDDETERSISPAFALGGHVYGDARGAAEDSQVVLGAADKEISGGGLTGYVEAVTDDGYALVVQDGQRFVFPPVAGSGPSPTPGRGESTGMH